MAEVALLNDPTEHPELSGDEKILEECKSRYKLCSQYGSSIIEEAARDLKFLSGEQWDQTIRDRRERESRPTLTINRLNPFVNQVKNDLIQNKPDVKIRAVDTSDTGTANVLNGLIRHIITNLDGKSAIDWALTCAIRSGIGYFRIKSKYCYDNEGPISADQFLQELTLERIEDPLLVHWPIPMCKMQDYSDAPYCIIRTSISKRDYKAMYPTKWEEFEQWESNHTEAIMDWVTDENVWLAEYFRIEHQYVTIYQLADGSVVEGKKSIPPGAISLRERELDKRKVMRYLLSGSTVLEKTEILAKNIPVVPVFGDELIADGKKRYISLIRFAKDVQSMYNMWKCLALTTMIPTPSGWTTMGGIGIGDKVFDDQGKVCKVLNVSPIWKDHKCFDIEFDGGLKITADDQHLWEVEERGKRTSKTWEWTKKILTTADLKPGKHFVYTTKPLDLPEQDFVIPPYILGLWLGDGDSQGPCLTEGREDMSEIIGHIQSFGCEVGKETPTNSAVKRTILGLRNTFVTLNLLYNKHIPQHYLRASKQQRLELLQGLMDSDGSIHKGHCSFTTTSIEISKGFSELLSTLGIKSVYYKRDRVGQGLHKKVEYQYAFTTYEPVFRLSRKLSKQGLVKEELRRTHRYAVKSITPVKTVPVRCIQVDSESSLYLAGEGMIPTHNSKETEMIALAPKAPFMAAMGQIDKYIDDWKSANTKNIAVLQYNPISYEDGTPVPPPSRLNPPAIDMATITAAKECVDDIKSCTGIYDASLGQKGNETSGKAIVARQRQGDTANAHFYESLVRGLRLAGKILIDMIPSYYDTPRTIAIVGQDLGQEVVKLNQMYQDTKTGKNLLYDLTKVAHYAVVVDTGPTYETRRIETAQNIISLIQANPQLFNTLGDILVQNLDWEGSDKAARRIRAMIPPQVLAADEDDTQEQGNIQNLMTQMRMLQQKSQSDDQLKQQMDQLIQHLQAQIGSKNDELMNRVHITDIRAQAELQKARIGLQTEKVKQDAHLVDSAIELHKHGVDSQMGMSGPSADYTGSKGQA